MPSAIRVDGNKVFHGKRHIELVMDYGEDHGLTENELDSMIEAGRIEFGSVWWVCAEKRWDFSGNETRNFVYSSIDKMIEINGR